MFTFYFISFFTKGEIREVHKGGGHGTDTNNDSLSVGEIVLYSVPGGAAIFGLFREQGGKLDVFAPSLMFCSVLSNCNTLFRGAGALHKLQCESRTKPGAKNDRGDRFRRASLFLSLTKNKNKANTAHLNVTVETWGR